MPKKTTVKRAKRALRQGKRPSTAAGEFVREEITHIRQGKHGARSTEQAIAIGLSKARRSGVPLAPPGEHEASPRTRRSARRDYEVGQGEREPRRGPSKRRSKATSRALEREGRSAASKPALASHARKTAPTRRRKTKTRSTRATRQRPRA